MATRTAIRTKKIDRSTTQSRVRGGGNGRRGGSERGGNGRGGNGRGGNGIPHRAVTIVAPARGVCDLIRGQIDRAIESDSVEVLIAALGTVARQRAQAETESVKAYLFQELIREIDRPAMRR